MKITSIQITGLAGGTVEGGWADEIIPEVDGGNGRQSGIMA